MKKIVVLVVRDEEFYIDMALDSIISDVEGIYILDTGSKDRTLSIITDFATRFPNKIVCEDKDFGGITKFAVGYREMNARNFALERATAFFDPDWIICMDADEVFAKKFWTYWGTRINMNHTTVGHPTECPTSPEPIMISRHPQSMVNWRGQQLHDPHVRIWNNRKQKVRWIHPNGRHVVLSSNGQNDLSCDVIIPEPVHFHFHHSFGPKSIYSYLSAGLITQPGNLDGTLPTSDIYNQAIYERDFPQLFNEKGQFMVNKQLLQANKSISIPLVEEFKFSSIVTDKWQKWGDYTI